MMQPGAAPAVWVVDDDPMIVRVLNKRLEALGLSVRGFTDPCNALDELQAFRPHLMILDVNMPNTNGFAIAERLIREYSDRPIPVIFLTGASDGETKRRITELGAQHVEKSVDAWGELFPLVCASVPVPAQPPTKVQVPEPRSAPALLLIDDDENLTRLLAVRLRRLGFETYTASNGMQGLWQAINRRPDLIILDYWMPGITGSYVTGRLSEHPATSDIPVIIFTGHEQQGKTDYSLVRELTDLGAAAVVQKTSGFDVLRQHIQAFLVDKAPVADSI